MSLLQRVQSKLYQTARHRLLGNLGVVAGSRAASFSTPPFRSLSVSSTANPTRGTSITTSSSSTKNKNKNGEKPTVHYLDLQASELSAIERLCLEEALLRHDPLQRSWAIVGTHHPSRNMHLNLDLEQLTTSSSNGHNEDCVIIMGIGGKPERLLHMPKVREDGVLTIKRFSGGGTVVVDESSLWTTFIGRNEHFGHYVDPFPRNIMKWSAEDVFHDVFDRMRIDALHHERRDQDADDNTELGGSEINIFPEFSLRENDYVLGAQKMGGNAQTITGQGWLHHTSFLWDYNAENMGYLSLPEKRPDYRGDRDHGDFLVKLKSVFGDTSATCVGVDESSAKRAFFYHVKCACQDSFELKEATVKDAIKIVDDELGGMQAWFDGKCRTKIIKV
uniref:BPL/LPL catalytic domain-containing protein n=1 Tax=Chaetoceros debilis TaxID=122233 RepID=A0A7S3PZ84_9STRA